MIHCKKKFPKSSPSVLRGTLALNLLARGHFHPAEGAVTLSSLSNRRHRFSELLKGLWTQRTAPSRPRSRGTFRKTRSRKWALPSRGLWGTRGQTGSSILRGGPGLSTPAPQSGGHDNPHEDHPRTGQPLPKDPCSPSLCWTIPCGN